MNASEMKIDELNREKDENVKDAAKSQIAVMLDRAIVALMVAILMLLSWPVCQVMWQQLRPHLAQPITTQSSSMPKTESAEAVHQNVI